MGLCKCPKKKVTNHFCFEHKVNVCEFCMVNPEHQKCVVQPYLQWLEDSSYSATCTFCASNLADADCVRLSCYHVFHWHCLNKFGQDLPPSTDSLSYSCPDCHKSIFPPASVTTPVAQAIRQVLATTEWARAGLGQTAPASPSTLLTGNDPHRGRDSIPHVVYNSPAANGSANSIPVAVNNVSYYVNMGDSNSYVRKIHESPDHPDTRPLLSDVDENKYRAKSPFEFLGRWFRTQKSLNRNTPGTYRRFIILGLILLLAFVTVVHYFLKMGRESADSDLSLDPAFNPHIRIEE